MPNVVIQSHFSYGKWKYRGRQRARCSGCSGINEYQSAKKEEKGRE